VFRGGPVQVVAFSACAGVTPRRDAGRLGSAVRTFSLRAVDLLAGWQWACPLRVAKTVSGASASNNTVSRCGRHTFHHPATGILFVGKAWWQLIAILLTAVIVTTVVVLLAHVL
jgi:hypothetical protein